MASNVVLGVRVVKNEYQRIKVDNVDLNGKVKILRETASEKINKDQQELELIFAGIILEDNASLSSYGIKQGFTIHVLEKKIPDEVPPIKHLTESEILQLVTTLGDYKLKNIFSRLTRPEVVEKVSAATPSLSDNPAAIALLQDPELLSQLADIAVMKRALNIHPILHEALAQLITYSKENAICITQTQAGTSTGYSYSLDALSDDEDMESDTAREGFPLTRNASYNAITAAQLAAAIANATTNFSSTGAVINPPAQNATASNASNSVITSEMFGNALQQAFASSPGINTTTPAFPSPASQSRNVEESMDAIRTRLQPQLQQMREMGLTNDTRNIRALQATSGDVQAAIELVFNGID